MVSKRWAQASIAFLVAGAAIGAACGGDDDATPTPTVRPKSATAAATTKAIPATPAVPGKGTATTVPATPAVPPKN